MLINGKSRVVGVFGFPVTHSRSPVMQQAALDALGLNWAYVPFSVDPTSVEDAVKAIRALDLVGVNVTVPLKELIAPFCDWVDPTASRINSINTIVNVEGHLLGYSTDGPGLLWDLADKQALPEVGGKILVLGAGGSAKAVVWDLASAGYEIFVSNRTRSRAERMIAEFGITATVVDWDKSSLAAAAGKVNLIVNTTTVGMSSTDAVADEILPPGSLTSRSTVYDLVYSPPTTPLMIQAKEAGAANFNGLGMLVRQGALSLSLWTGIDRLKIPIVDMESALLLA